MAPEMIRRKPYNSKVDIWSTGALCMEMAEGCPPYYAFKPLKALFLTATVGAPSLKKDKWSDSFKDFLKKCFEMDSSTRDSAEVLLKVSRSTPEPNVLSTLSLPKLANEQTLSRPSNWCF
jgi:serine/threonine protein kinase